MNFEHYGVGQDGYFKAVEDETEAGRMTYLWLDKTKIIIDHTTVSPDFKGRNIGKQLLMEGVKFARENNLTIIPQCPFAKSVFEKQIEIQDVI